MTERKRVPEQAGNAPVDVTKMNIYQKIMMVSSESGNIEKKLEIATKTDKNGKTLSSYKAASFWDIVDAIKPYLTLYHLDIIPEQDETCGKKVVSDDIVTRSTNYGEREERRVIMWSVLRIVNADNPQEYILSAGIGEGRDSGDKAYNKANTNSKKNAIIDAFNLSIGDDPDKDASLEYYQTSDNKQMDKNLILEPKAVSEKEFQDYVEIINMINSERRKLEKYVDIRSEKFLKFLKEKTGLETTDPANLGDSALRKLYIFLRKVREAKQEQADTTDKVMDYNTGEVIDNDDLPF